MSQTIVAIYEQGFLRPLEPLSLQERQKVRIQILPDPIIDKAGQGIQFLINMGWLTPPSGRPEVTPVSSEERLRIADILSKAAKKSVSEMIIEDRGEW